MFNLHPSGFCSWSSDKPVTNLVAGFPCLHCKRIAGHSHKINDKISVYWNQPCPNFKAENRTATSSRGKLFNAVSILWNKNKERSFFTFTLPSLENQTYQKDSLCETTGDAVIGKMFSKVMDAWRVKEKRKTLERLRPISGSVSKVLNTFSYVWVCEAQTKRQEKFGGVGDLHYHLIVNRKLKNDFKGNNGKFNFVNQEAKELFEWIQNNWCKQIKTTSKNCVHVDPLPDYINSIPAYVSKYFGKGSQRPIYCRRFQASQDLSIYKPVKLTGLPEIKLLREVVSVTPNGFEVVTRYFPTKDVINVYGRYMKDQGGMSSKRGNGASLTKHGKSLDRIKAKLSYS